MSDIQKKLMFRPHCATLLRYKSSPQNVISPTLAIRNPPTRGFSSFQPFTPKRLSSHTPPDFPRSAALGKRHWCSFETSRSQLIGSAERPKKAGLGFFVAKDGFFEKNQGLGRWLCFFCQMCRGKNSAKKKWWLTLSYFFSQKHTLQICKISKLPPFWKKMITIGKIHPLVLLRWKNPPYNPIPTTTTNPPHP